MHPILSSPFLFLFFFFARFTRGWADHPDPSLESCQFKQCDDEKNFRGLYPFLFFFFSFLVSLGGIGRIITILFSGAITTSNVLFYIYMTRPFEDKRPLFSLFLFLSRFTRTDWTNHHDPFLEACHYRQCSITYK